MPKPSPIVGHFSSVPWIPSYAASENWPVTLLPCESSDVRQVAARCQVDITPMAVADWFELGDEWHRLGSWGIAFRGKADSVCLFSPCPIEDLHLAEIAISRLTTSSVRILEALLKGKYGLGIGPWRRNVEVEDATTPRLLIQNEAVEERGRRRFAYVYDLGSEWHDWQSTPLVPAVWAYRAGTDPAKVELVKQLLGESIARYHTDPLGVVAAHRRIFKWTASVEEVLALHRNFEYDLSNDDFVRGIERMRALLPRQVQGFEVARRLG